ncbi:regulatory helix-turn-helix protein, lysR family [Arthrobacter cupressi]|uniref:Regulatory helix-turn-helix protein, lysR family n=1 Tax=Arthrobacter cupressi TaxID=1045773 RepID=A0A1G8RB67_9MICC|nr:LysR family transcriptional regulator [Arthrobacter cupressi]NYD77794.1 Fe-S oxidoreductase [Arthrobacter cupressi]SDJ14093.1 regulatory helix-turn-helix protein, lysR family [Arthrobacter cupressi]
MLDLRRLTLLREVKLHGSMSAAARELAYSHSAISQQLALLEKETGEQWVDGGWAPPAMPSAVTVQTHCHEYSTFGTTVQRKALAALGVADVTEATGCCGVAGNFGFEANHYGISMKVAQQALAPALEGTAPDTPVLADGFSCAMQVKQLEPQRKSLHLAELLDPGNTAS